MYPRLGEIVGYVKREIENGVEIALRRYEKDSTYLLKDEYRDRVRQEIEAVGIELYKEKAVFTHVNRLFALYQIEEKGIVERYISAPDVGQGEILQAYIYGIKDASGILDGVFEGGVMHGELLPDSVNLWKAVERMRRWRGEVLDEGNLWLKDDLLGWVYQLYGSEKEREIRKIQRTVGHVEKAKDIRAITQFYTDDYIVEYIVEKTLGYAEQDRDYKEMKVLDLSVGSGHFLIKAFDWFAERYEKEGIEPVQIVMRILRGHLYGLDIDERAVQIARLMLMLKGAEYLKNRGIEPRWDKIPRPNVYAPAEGFFEDFKTKRIRNAGIIPPKVVDDIEDSIKHLELYGSLVDPDLILQGIREIASKGLLLNVKEEFLELLKSDIEEYIKGKVSEDIGHQVIGQQVGFLEILFRDYDVVVANPPYLNRQNIGGKLKIFLEKYYPETRDLFQAFMMRSTSFTKPRKGYWGMVNMATWLYAKTISQFREKLFETSSVVHIVDFGTGAFKEASKLMISAINIFRSYISSDDEITVLKVDDLDYDGKRSVLLDVVKDPHLLNTKYKDRVYKVKLDTLKRWSRHIEKYGMKVPIIYVLNEEILSLWDKHPTVGEVAYVPRGLTTGRDKAFIRYHWEVRCEDINFNYPEEKNYPRWVPLSKGGGAVKWYGGLWWVIDWEGDGRRLKSFKKATVLGEEFYGRESVFLAGVSREKLIRYLPKGLIFSHKTIPIFAKNEPTVSPYIYQVFLGSEPIRFIAYYVEPIHSTDIWLISLLPFPKEIPERHLHLAESLGKIGIAIKKKRLSILPIEFHYEGSPISQYGSVEKHREMADALDVYLHLIEGVVDKVAQEVYGISDETLEYIYRHLGRPVAYEPLVDKAAVNRFIKEYPLQGLLTDRYLEEFGIEGEDIERVERAIKAFVREHVDVREAPRYSVEDVKEAYEEESDVRRYYWGSGIEGVSRHLKVHPVEAFYIMREIVESSGLPKGVERYDKLLSLDEAIVDILRSSQFGIKSYRELMKEVPQWFEKKGVKDLFTYSELKELLTDVNGYPKFHKRLYKNRPIVYYISEKGYGRGAYRPRGVLYGLHHRVGGVWLRIVEEEFKREMNMAIEDEDRKRVMVLEAALKDIEGNTKLMMALDEVEPDEGVEHVMKVLGKLVWKK